MRITNNMLINNMMFFMNNNLDRMQKYQTQLSTGKKITVPSDDPIVAAKALKLRTDVAEVAQFKRNSSDAASWMDTTENTLGNVVDILQRARELAVQAANGTLTPGDRDKIKQEIEQLKGQSIHLANTTYAGRYIFSGYATDTKLINEDGTYATAVSSNETAVIKSGLIDVSKTAVNIAAPDNQFQICLDGANYKTITVPNKNYTGAPGDTLDDLANDIQNAILGSGNPELNDIKVTNDNGRIQFSLKNTTDPNGNRLKVYIQEAAGDNFLDNIKIKTDNITGISVSKKEDINYQVGISDMLNINVLGTELFGSGTKGDVGDFLINFNKFIDSLVYPEDGNSYISSQPLVADASNQLDLSTNNEFSIQVGSGAPVSVILNGSIYNGTPSLTLNDLAADMQAKINAAIGSNNVTVTNLNGKITISENSGQKITLIEGPSGSDALKSLKLYTKLDKTITSVTANEGISNSITNFSALMDRVMSIRSDIGARMNRAELTLNRLESDDINFTKLMSDNEDVDMAEAIMNLKNEENVYKASLAGGARVIMPTLIDFLR